MINLLPVPVLLAIFGAATTLVVPRRPGVQRLISVACLSGIVIVAGLFMYATSTTGPMALWLGGWHGPFSDHLGWVWTLLKGFMVAMLIIWMRVAWPRVRAT